MKECPPAPFLPELFFFFGFSPLQWPTWGFPPPTPPPPTVGKAGRVLENPALFLPRSKPPNLPPQAPRQNFEKTICFRKKGKMPNSFSPRPQPETGPPQNFGGGDINPQAGRKRKFFFFCFFFPYAEKKGCFLLPLRPFFFFLWPAPPPPPPWPALDWPPPPPPCLRGPPENLTIHPISLSLPRETFCGPRPNKKLTVAPPLERERYKPPPGSWGPGGKPRRKKKKTPQKMKPPSPRPIPWNSFF